MASVESQSIVIPTDNSGLGTKLQRLGYRIANGLIQADRRIRSSHGRGVKLIVSDSAGNLLMVRHTYGRRHWTFPGGGVRASEAPDSAAIRECAEELGFEPLRLDLLGTHPARSKRRLDVVSVFAITGTADLPKPSKIELDSIGWFSPFDLPVDRDPNVNVALGLLQGRNAEVAASRHHAT